MFTHHEDMKGDEKCKIIEVVWGLGVSGITQGHRKHCHLIERI